MTNPYLEQIEKVLPRIFALYDRDVTSPCYGLGDRHYWAWKVIDFPNATYQGVVHGLAILLKHNLLTSVYTKQYLLEFIDSVFYGTRSIMRADGSLEEAFPYEASFCVTGLVAYEQLSALCLLQDIISPQLKSKYLSFILPMIKFLCRSKETHGFISNHLAVASAALYKWSLLVEDLKVKKQAENILLRVLDNQSLEGWYLEYEGADPGYQSLCLDYLSDIYVMTGNPQLKESLKKSIEFLSYCVHPDGSFGGIYGSRNTRFYYPGGLESLAPIIPIAWEISKHMVLSIQEHATVTLDVVDQPNLIPMFNSYCVAASYFDKNVKGTIHSQSILPYKKDAHFRIFFKHAGLLIDKGKRHYTLVSVYKGGVCYHFLDGILSKKDVGKVFIRQKGRYLSTQVYNPTVVFDIKSNVIEISGPMAQLKRTLPSPLMFLFLRLGNLTFLRITFFRELAKKMLVMFLITQKRYTKFFYKRTINLGEDLTVVDEASSKKLIPKNDMKNDLYTIHMASQGYWQKQDIIT